MLLQESTIPCPDDWQCVPLYEGLFDNNKDKTADTKDRSPSSNKGFRLMMMGQHNGGRAKDSSKDTPTTDNEIMGYDNAGKIRPPTLA